MKYYAIYKPFMMLSQFTSELGKTTLASLDFKFDTDIYPIGRLDEDSEGLLLLSNDSKLNKKLLDPVHQHKRTYYAQVENIPQEFDLQLFTKGITLNNNGKQYCTLPANASIISEPDFLPNRIPPIRFRKNIPTSWISITLQEGKNRQVRKMTAHIGFPTLRLVRFSIEQIDIKGFKSGEVREYSQKDFYRLLNL
jgi:23S rRNA pseudouridine2457 synthase